MNSSDALAIKMLIYLHFINIMKTSEIYVIAFLFVFIIYYDLNILCLYYVYFNISNYISILHMYILYMKCVCVIYNSVLTSNQSFPNFIHFT